MERFLLLWDEVSIHYHRAELRPFPVEPQRKLLVELFPLMKPVAEIIVIPQARTTVKSIDTYLAMCNLSPTILDESAPLPIRDPALDGYKKGIPVRLEPSNHLEVVTRKTRKLLRVAMVKRFYNGYHGIPRPISYEMAVFLHPSHRKLGCLERHMSAGEATMLREKVKADIHKLAVTVAKASPVDLSETQEPPSKKPRSERGVTGQGIWNFSSFEECDDEEGDTERNIEDDVIDEIDLYLENEKVKAADLPSRNLLTWWKSKSTRYPNLRLVARAVLGHPASAAAIERVFGLFVLAPSRSRTDAAFVDMQIFLRAQLTNLPAHVPKLNDTNRIDKVPDRFTGVEQIERLAMTYEEDSEDTEMKILTSRG